MENNRPFDQGEHPGVDDGFFPGNKVPNNLNPTQTDYVNNGSMVPRARRPSVTFPYGPDGPGVIMINGVATEIPDVNIYQHKKTLAQGMMDLALLSANANQLRYVIQMQQSFYFYVSLIFIALSIVLQVAVGVGLIWNSRYNVKDEREICKANKANNYTVIGIFVVTVVNVFISAFGVPDNVAS
ncbi:hypothetical protein ACFFRR_011585 [Megaselia abdita]